MAFKAIKININNFLPVLAKVNESISIYYLKKPHNQETA